MWVCGCLRASHSWRVHPWEGPQASGSDEFVESTDHEIEVVEARISAPIQCVLRDLDEVNLEDVSQGDQVRSSRGWKLMPAVVVVWTLKRREHQQTEVEPTVPGFREGMLGSSAGRYQIQRGDFFVLDRDVAVATRPRTSTNVQPKFRRWSNWVSSARQALEGADLDQVYLPQQLSGTLQGDLNDHRTLSPER